MTMTLRNAQWMLAIGVAWCSLIGASRVGAQEPAVARCEALTQTMQGQWPDPNTRIVGAIAQAFGP
jgi:hypothetical protein